MPPDSLMTVLETIGKFRVQQALATGQASEVFLGRRDGPDGTSRLVAIKRVRPPASADRGFLPVYLAEARAAMRLTHANLVQTLEVLEEADGSVVVAMEPVLGKSLHEVATALLRARRPFPPGALAQICAQALTGLHYAHTLRSSEGDLLGLVHREVSPAHVMVSFNGAAKVVAFGLARALRSPSAWASPEQLALRRLDPRADVWAMAVTMYELLAGRHPFEALDDASRARSITQAQPTALTGVPPALAAIVMRGLEKDPVRRFPNAQVMAAALERFAATRATVEVSPLGLMRELFGSSVDEEMSAISPSGRLLDPTGEHVVPVAEEGVHAPPTHRRTAVLLGSSAAIAMVGTVAAVLTFVSPASGRTVVAQGPLDAGPSTELVERATPPPSDPPQEITAPPREGLTPPVAPRAGKGVELRVTPWADVFEGRKKLGRTPLPVLALKPGRHVLTLTNPDLGTSRQLTLKVPRSGVLTVDVDLSE